MTELAGATLPDWLIVSRETNERLIVLWEMVKKWNRAVNLVADGSITDGWRRHIVDAAQLFLLLDSADRLSVDFGSGGGFPGLVLAAIAAEKAANMKFLLVESDRRKAAFLVQASRAMNIATEVLTSRAENMASLQADIVTARAVASLDVLCGLAAKHLKAGGVAIFPKGGSYAAEIEQARRNWIFDCQNIASRTDPRSAILVLRNIRHA